jgi:phenylalanyl-tRNA synthetase beta chain
MAKDILKAAGFTEVYNYSFVSEKDKEIFGNGNLVEIENPTSDQFKYVRPSLVYNLLKNISKNERNFSNIKIFEIGKASKYESKGISEKKMLVGAMTGNSFYEAKGVIDLLLNKFGISSIRYDDSGKEIKKSNIWHLKKCGEIKIDGDWIGFLGEISAEILEKLKIKDKVVAFEIDFEKLAKLASEEHEYRPLSRFPAAVRDLALLVPLETKVEDVLNKIETAGGSLIRDVDLFDIYEGEELPEGKKNLAFHIVYQAADRTLTSQEIEKIQTKIIQSLEKEVNWEVRK